MSETTSERRFRRATMDDLPVMLKIYQHARELMAANGNPTQWGNTFPREEVILDDIRQQRTMLLVDEADGKERVLAQFALCTGEDPTYAHIDGAWLDDDSYVTIHRIASSGIVKGAAKDCINWCIEHYGNVRAELEKDGAVPTLANVRRVIISIRKNKLPDPEVMGNAGSFFMNPVIPRSQFERLRGEYPDMPSYPLEGERVKVPAGWLIDRCGWKGKSLGPAAVHDRQALVLVNRGGATGRDVLRLAGEVVRSVQEKFGIAISPEVNVIE